MLTGLLGMHGLTSNHNVGVDLGTVWVGTGPEIQRTHASADRMSSDHPISAPSAQRGVEDVPTLLPGAPPPAHGPYDHPDHDALMVACLAVLAGTALVLLLLALILLPRAPGSRWLTRRWSTSAFRESPPAYLSPRLSKLCVSRT